ncbi:MAG: hypothetical protein VB961_07845, partial [Dehalococcoidia bacterium]
RCSLRDGRPTEADHELVVNRIAVRVGHTAVPPRDADSAGYRLQQVGRLLSRDLSLGSDRHDQAQ